jgi:L-fuconolactonase
MRMPEDSRLRALGASGENRALVRIDAHQHFWRYAPEAYPWIDARMGAIARDFLPADLAPALAAARIDGCIAVQARASAAENDFLLGLARAHPLVRGVVGWVDLTAPDVERALAPLADEPLIVGVRHLVQDEPDERFLARPDFRRGVAALVRHGLVYDVLVRPRQLAAVRAFVTGLPEQPLVLDHCGKPPLAGTPAERAAWERDFRALGGFPHLACKLSGLVTEARWHAWEQAELAAVLDVALETFGPERLLFGSDWPVCLLAADGYSEVHAVVDAWSRPLGADARVLIFGANAARVYRLA